MCDRIKSDIETVIGQGLWTALSCSLKIDMKDAAKGQAYQLQEAIPSCSIVYNDHKPPLEYPVNGWIITPNALWIGNVEGCAWTLITEDHELAFDADTKLQSSVIGQTLIIWGEKDEEGETFELETKVTMVPPFSIGHLLHVAQKSINAKTNPVASKHKKALNLLANGENYLKLEIKPGRCSSTIDSHSVDTIVITANRLIVGNWKEDVWAIHMEDKALANLVSGDKPETGFDDGKLAIRNGELERLIELKHEYTKYCESEPEEKPEPVPAPANKYNIARIAGCIVLGFALTYVVRRCYLKYLKPPATTVYRS